MVFSGCYWEITHPVLVQCSQCHKLFLFPPLPVCQTFGEHISNSVSTYVHMWKLVSKTRYFMPVLWHQLPHSWIKKDPGYPNTQNPWPGLKSMEARVPIEVASLMRLYCFLSLASYFSFRVILSSVAGIFSSFLEYDERIKESLTWNWKVDALHQEKTVRAGVKYFTRLPYKTHHDLICCTIIIVVTNQYKLMIIRKY